MCPIDGFMTLLYIVSSKTNRPKGQMSSKTTCLKMLQNQMDKMYIFTQEMLQNGGRFHPMFFVFVLHLCATPLCYTLKSLYGHKKTPYKTRR